MNGTGVKLREEGDKLILDGSAITLEDMVAIPTT